MPNAAFSVEEIAKIEEAISRLEMGFLSGADVEDVEGDIRLVIYAAKAALK